MMDKPIFTLDKGTTCTAWNYRGQRRLAAGSTDGTLAIYDSMDPASSKKFNCTARFKVAAYSDGQVKIFELLDSLVLEKCSNSPILNSSKGWEFDQDHQRWLPVAELASPDDKNDHVFAVAWAPNIGSCCHSQGIAIWHLGSNPDSSGRLFTEKIAVLSGHDGEVW
ncbi:unnamed protein product [Fraxinus pennsylvanica]|uniref:Uncharacterized protein n=1 Tax=Fraxinus pennsylvanica TaxID=56036 RepID=A0AAD2DS53_9LAMI|nr:unnamed protein product [Fraxinus pennsylvanica]